MRILVIDAQGGGIGKQLVADIKKELPDAYITAVGTNSTATAAMLKAGADEAATGENPAIVACRTADVIVGPIGIVIADAMLGEVTPKMALAVAQSRAERVLIPFNHCNNRIVGIAGKNVSAMVGLAVETIKNISEKLDNTR